MLDVFKFSQTDLYLVFILLFFIFQALRCCELDKDTFDRSNLAVCVQMPDNQTKTGKLELYPWPPCRPKELPKENKQCLRHGSFLSEPHGRLSQSKQLFPFFLLSARYQEPGKRMLASHALLRFQTVFSDRSTFYYKVQLWVNIEKCPVASD